jgi:hypothetical protein
MDIMTGENNSSENFIKDTKNTSASLVSYQKDSKSLAYLNARSNKLITALYMVTDMMDKEEPLRTKLRSVGADILSDMCSVSYRTEAFLINRNINKIAEAMSFLEIAMTMKMISEMNYQILAKEFFNLKESLEKHSNLVSIEEFLNSNPDSDLVENTSSSEFLREDNQVQKIQNSKSVNSDNARVGFEEKKLTRNFVFKKDNGQMPVSNSARIGIQKGSTLLKAIKDIKGINSIKDINRSGNRSLESTNNVSNNKASFDDLKKERRAAILKIIKDKKLATITDIKMYASGALASCGEKTLQRELIAMVADGVLKKVGEKRWSKYFL